MTDVEIHKWDCPGKCDQCGREFEIGWICRSTETFGCRPSCAYDAAAESRALRHRAAQKEERAECE